jgi:acyl dehydratase
VAGLYFSDIRAGQIFETETHQVSRSEILDFATAFDPNPFHLDDGAADSAGLDGIIASGFHTLSLSFRLFFELHLWDDAVLPSPGLNKVRWLRPLYPGGSVWVRATVTETVRSTSKPGQGVVHMLQETVLAPSGDVILTVEAMHRLKLRPV